MRKRLSVVISKYHVRCFTVVSHDRPVSHARNTAYLTLNSFQHCEYLYFLMPVVHFCEAFTEVFGIQHCQSVNVVNLQPKYIRLLWKL